MKKIKAVIFDMGGVLVDLDVEGCKRAFKSLLGYDRIDQIIDACHQKGIYGDLEEGTLSAADFRRIVLEDSFPGADPSLVDKAMWNILVGIAPYKTALLKRLSGEYDLYLLSNNNPICMPRSRRIFEEAGIPLDVIFRRSFLSYEMKALKPSESFYRAVVAQIGLPADRMVFIDDSHANVEGAVAAGLPAVYYEPGSDLSALVSEVLGDASLSMEGSF